ncbi:hypothetical protein B566_EDAN017091 [Ephemera danica]|nr:hypothetical protein B566_EDAN017091 [Ephemera danica]
MISSMCTPRTLGQVTTQPTLHWGTRHHSYSSSSSGGVTSVTLTGGTRRSWSPPRRPRSAPGSQHRLSAPAAPAIETEEEYVEFYQARIATAQQRQLLPLQEDLADWLNKLLGEF